ncbi:large neutral amino acids transporter small subunit 2-like [Poecile atricapillus]|uniref:large neutral amino acids transporter small subunit 2-like n=1 Tax=Poecile atricapillus TaxID=48891 RepID=UPI00273843A9|nr:large neutral amino acids transporter small subunit 2-like [Poecile atricapillus]
MKSAPKTRGNLPKNEEKPEEDEGVALKKEIGLLSACGIIVGNIIGSGIFVAPRGVLAHAGAVGPSLIVWALSGAVTAAGALCYAELGVALPLPGGDYAYVSHAFGPLTGFLRLWISLLVIYPTNQAVIALTFANYVLQPLFPSCPTPESAQRILAAACLLLLTWVNCGSARWATRVQDAFTGGKLLALALIVGAGALLMARGEHFWLRPSQAFTFWAGPGAGPLFLACLQGSFAYGGWNFLNYVTEELRDPERNLPLAISISLPLVTFLYVAANVAYLAAMSPQEILQSDAVAVTFGEKVLGPMAWVMPFAVALSTFGGVNGSLFTCSRLFYAGARAGQLPALLAMIHLRRRTPVPALLITCASTLLMLVTGDIYTLINYVGFVNYLWYGVTVAGLLLLRWREPELPRPIRVRPRPLPGKLRPLPVKPRPLPV